MIDYQNNSKIILICNFHKQNDTGKINRVGNGNFEKSNLIEGPVNLNKKEGKTRQPQSYLSSVLFHLVSSLLFSCLPSCLLLLFSLSLSVSVCCYVLFCVVVVRVVVCVVVVVVLTVCINDVFVDLIKQVHLIMEAVSLWTRPRPCTCVQGPKNPNSPSGH